MEPYCKSRFRTFRRKTHEVLAGKVGIGGNNPIRIQSMTTSNTQDVKASVAQCIALAEAGCEIVRLTAPNIQAGLALKDIRREFSAAGFTDIPLVADIHFLPQVAMEAVEHVEKVRINPGNYADKKKFLVKEYSDADYAKELERLHEAVSPLILRAKKLGRSLRIGVNHGSLSDRVMNRFGDTPQGMVESALEFLRIAESHDYRQIVLSMKSSNPKVVVHAYRLLTRRMDELGMSYPLHLGVTEAGDGEDARIKSAIGIGSLLYDGIGDTIRVSLTEDSVNEIPVARALAEKAMALWSDDTSIPPASDEQLNEGIDFYAYAKKESTPVEISSLGVAGGVNIPRVLIRQGSLADLKTLFARGEVQSQMLDTPIEAAVVPFATIGAPEEIDGIPSGRGLVLELEEDRPFSEIESSFQTIKKRPLFLLKSFAEGDADKLHEFLEISRRHKLSPIAALTAKGILSGLGNILKAKAPSSLILTVDDSKSGAEAHILGEYRAMAAAARQHSINAPIWIRNKVSEGDLKDKHGAAALSALLDASMLNGALLCDGIGDMISVEAVDTPMAGLGLAYNILQGAGARVTKTEFVACPSCGRTLFNLQETTRRIRARTGHLKGVKIAIMGCIVNGPGEMADADFGYVGGAPGKINLYVGRQCVQFNIPQAEADDRLIALIKEHGKWTDYEGAK